MRLNFFINVQLILLGCLGILLSGCDDKKVDEVIGSQGGSIQIAQIASLTFPAGAFSSDRRVKLSITKSTKVIEDFSNLTEPFGVTSPIPYMIRINTGSSAPANSVEIFANIPTNLLNTIPANSSPQIFIKLAQGNDEEIYYNFDTIDSTFDKIKKTINASLPSEAFSDDFTTNGTFQAELFIALTPDSPITANSAATKVGNCDGEPIESPLNRFLLLTSKFGGGHKGIDLDANDPDLAVAADSGKVISIQYDLKDCKTARCKRLKLKKQGGGHLVIIKHNANYFTTYNHLKKDSIEVIKNQMVTRGQTIGTTDSSGGVTRPHLHFEYRLERRTKFINPAPCIYKPFPVTSTATFLLTNQDPDSTTDVRTIDLNSMGIKAGMRITIERVGDFTFFKGPPPSPEIGRSLIGIFSRDSNLLPSTQLNRVPGAILTPGSVEINTDSTLYGNLKTNISQDFLISNDSTSFVTVIVPTGAKYLFISPNDRFFGDNDDSNKDLGVRIYSLQ